jgi:hypothetical protein
MSYKAEVVADSGGAWTGNRMRFATKKEAELYVLDLALRWTLVGDIRVVESDEPVNYELVDGRFVHIEGAP